MMYKSNIKKSLSLVFGIAALVLTSGFFTDASAQTRDPFSKPGYKQPKSSAPARPAAAASNPVSQRPTAAAAAANTPAAKPAGPVLVAAPSIQDRIDYYYRVREQAAESGQEIPKVTSVLLLNEMTVSGIFKTPRGYAALVEATPIKLSYTIYPGEKFFDGQLVAVEENRLVFRKVSKMSGGKFVSTVENKPLRKYTLQQELQGAVPSETNANTEAGGGTILENSAEKIQIISPLEEMNKKASEEKEESAKDKKDKKDKKKPSKRKSVARKN